MFLSKNYPDEDHDFRFLIDIFEVFCLVASIINTNSKIKKSWFFIKNIS